MTDRILVVGGAGYIGSHVVQAFLNDGCQVTVYDNMSTGQEVNLFPDARLIVGDVQDRTRLKQVFSEGFDAVVHLAALKAAGESMVVPEQYAYQNINGTMNLLEAVSLSTTRIIIFSSSAAVYGNPQYLPMDEQHRVDPINFYGFTKHEIERFLTWYDRLRGIRFASLRYFNAAGYDPEGRITGLEQNPANLIPVVMEVLTGRREQMTVFGTDYPTPDGTCIRDYIHVSDLAKAHLMSYRHIRKVKRSITLNLGTGDGHSVFEIIRMSEKITGKRLNYIQGERRPGDAAKLLASSAFAEKTIGWCPEMSDLESIIWTTWHVYQENTRD